jgi:hypothetical protein
VSDHTSGFPTGSKHPIVSSEHALHAGMVWGVAMKHGLDLLPVLDDAGNYSAEVELVLPVESTGWPGNVRVRLIVEPPSTPGDGAGSPVP